MGSSEPAVSVAYRDGPSGPSGVREAGDDLQGQTPGQACSCLSPEGRRMRSSTKRLQRRIVGACICQES